MLHSDRVQGRLRRLCETDGFQFQLIDLRWGVSQEAGWDQRTEQLCLEEIRRCQDVSPRPNFVALIGQRYGWRPLPQTLTTSDWTLLRDVASEHLPLLEDWYRPDSNNLPFVYRLRPRLSDQERDRARWEDVEVRLHSVLMQCLAQHPDKVSDAIRFADKSLTEKEIEHGTENARQRKWQAFAYFRDIDGKSRDELDEPFVDRDANGKMVDPRSSEKLAGLRARLEASESVATMEFAPGAEGDTVDPAYIDVLAEQIYQDLSQAISKQIAAFRDGDPLERELQKHTKFAVTRLNNYIPRPGPQRRIKKHVSSSKADIPLMIAAPSGGGKTALLAWADRELASTHPDRIIATRFVGATGESASLRSLVRSIHDEVAQATGTTPLDDNFTDQPMRLLGETLRLGSAKRPLVILLDALDQLASDDHARTLNWLPVRLPENAKLIISVMSTGPDGAESDVYRAALKRIPKSGIQTLRPMSRKELERAFFEWLKSFGRTVSAEQSSRVRAAIAACPRPLFVRLLAELARRWEAEVTPAELPRDIQHAVAAVLSQLEREEMHRRPLVAATLSKLAASRAGLTEPELVDLIGRDPRVVEDFEAHSRHEYIDRSAGLPPIIWSRLLLDLNFFLGQNSAAGIGLLNFYHRQLEFAARERYADAIQTSASEIADYFEAQPPVLHSAEASAPNLRRSFELVWQLRALDSDESSERIQALLTDTDFVEAKSQTSLLRDLLEDYFLQADATTVDELAAFLTKFLIAASDGAERLAPQVIQSYLAYLTSADDEHRPNLYRKILETLVESALPSDAPDAARRRVSRAKVSLGEQHRRDGEFDVARTLLDVIDAPNASLKGEDLATAWYEKAYIEYLDDDYRLAIDFFDRSSEAAEAVGDLVGAAIPVGPRQWAAYFADFREDTLREGIARERKVLETLRRYELTDPRAERWVYNTLAHLANLHYYLNDADGMTPYVLELRNNPWIRDYVTSRGLNRGQQHEARYLCAQRQFRRAVNAWLAVFEAAGIRRTQQSAAWLMYDFGFAMEQSGRKTQAVQIYVDGLNTPQKGACNAFWHDRIRERLNRFSQRVINRAQSSQAYVSPLL